MCLCKLLSQGPKQGLSFGRPARHGARIPRAVTTAQSTGLVQYIQSRAPVVTNNDKGSFICLCWERRPCTNWLPLTDTQVTTFD